jgi:hypothetical protein
MPETTDLDGSSVISVIALSRMGVERNQFGCLPLKPKYGLNAPPSIRLFQASLRD